MNSVSSSASLSRREPYSSEAGLPRGSLCGSCRGYSLRSKQGWTWIDLPPTFDGLRLHFCLGRFQDFTGLDEKFIYGEEDSCLGVLKKLHKQAFIKATK